MTDEDSVKKAEGDVDREDFETFEAIRQSGVTNMMDAEEVGEQLGGGRDAALEIMQNYGELKDKFGADQKSESESLVQKAKEFAEDQLGLKQKENEGDEKNWEYVTGEGLINEDALNSALASANEEEQLEIIRDFGREINEAAPTYSETEGMRDFTGYKRGERGWDVGLEAITEPSVGGEFGDDLDKVKDTFAEGLEEGATEEREDWSPVDYLGLKPDE